MPSSLVTHISLSGYIKTEAILSGTIKSNGTLHGSLCMPVGYKDYTGEYEITPKVIAQVAETADKHMVSDLIVKEIPYYEVSNQANGKTITIGG